jgi:BlaI family penicillinase repressor
MAQYRQLTKAEEQVMQALWKIEAGRTKDIIEQMPDPKPHYNTVSTILKILLEKNFVEVEVVGKSHRFHPKVQKDDYSRATFKQLVQVYFNGSFSNMLSFFAKEEDISAAELEVLLEEIKRIRTRNK